MIRIIVSAFIALILVGAVLPWSDGTRLGPVSYWHGYGYGVLGVAAIAALALVLLAVPCGRLNR